MINLENHLCKEEQILFPYIYELCEADAEGTKLPPFHCGSIESPIAVMMAEHDDIKRLKMAVQVIAC